MFNLKTLFYFMLELSPAVCKLLHMCNIAVEDNKIVLPQVIERATLTDRELYLNVISHIPSLKLQYSSTNMSSLQETAGDKQKWPLLNLVRQTLRRYNVLMTPVRMSDGYDSNGKKLFRRMFRIELSPIVGLESEVSITD